MLYRFVDCLLDTSLHTVQRAGQCIPLSPKVFAVLLYLIEHREHVVSKAELSAHIWQGLAISSAALESCLRDVRRALGDQGQVQRIIRTHRGYGYRFVADVTLPSQVVETSTHPATLDGLPSAPLPPQDVTSMTLPMLPPLCAALESCGVACRLVTVLCCAVTHGGSPAGRHDLDALQPLMHTLLALTRDVAQQYAGRLQAILGDCLVVLFGVPMTQEDDASRAVQAALALRHRFQAQQAAALPPGGTVALRMGLHTGPMMVTGDPDDRVSPGTVIGEVCSIALALQEQATPGQMLCSAATARLLHGTVRLARGVPVLLRGQPSPLIVHAIQGSRVRQWLGRRDAGSRRSPFVGRQREMATLHALLAEVETGRGQVVGVVGEAGMGKSRLLTEFRCSLRSRAVTFLTGQCLSYASTTPYLPVLHLLREACGLTGMERPEALRAKVTRSLQAVEMCSETWTPVVLDLLGVPAGTEPLAALSPEVRKARTLEILTQVCLRRSQQRPLILAIDDLHWIDASSAEAIAMLSAGVAGAPICILVTYRPGYHPAWLDKSYATQIALQPLSPQDSQRVVEAVLASTAHPLPLMLPVLSKADGNPFFLEELARVLLEQGPDILTVAVPDTIQAVLRGRLDRLPTTTLHILQAAAVIGKDVPVPLLQALTDAPEATLSQALQQLQAAEFLAAIPTREASRYTFKHTLTQEVAYSSLPPARRRVLHASIVTAIEQLAPAYQATQVDRLADHAFHGEVWDKAVIYSRQAGTMAAERSAVQEATAAFEQALAALQHLPAGRAKDEQAIDLRFALRNVLVPLGEHGRILDHLRQAEPLAQALGDQRRLGQSAIYMGVCLYQLGDPEAGIVSVQRALTIATALGARDLQITAHNILGEICQWALSDYRQGVAWLSRNVEMLQDISPQSDSVGALLSPVGSYGNLAWCRAELGAFADAQAYGAHALHLAEAVGHPYTLARACVAVGHASLRQGDLCRAVALFERGLALSERLHFTTTIRLCSGRLGVAYALAGRMSDAVPRLEQAHAQLKALRHQILYPLYAIWLGEGYLLTGCTATALSLAQQALDVARAYKQQGYEAEAWRLLGALALQHDSLDAWHAAECYQHASTLAEALGMRPLLAHCHLGLGRLYRHLGQWQQARHALSTAMALYQTLHMPFWLAQAAADLARCAEAPVAAGV